MTDFTDLLGVPWERATCSDVARAALERLGRPVPASALPSEAEAGSEALRALVGSGGPWRRVGDDYRAADQEGRVILSVGEDGGPHVSVVVRPGYVLSSARLQGSYMIRAARVQRIQGVYELR